MGERGTWRVRQAARTIVQHVPSGLSLARLAAAFWLPSLARRKRRLHCATIMAGSVMVDLLDGILARRVCVPAALRRQRRLDGHADAIFTIVAPLAAYRLRPDLPARLRTPIAALFVAQSCSTTVSLLRFRRLPRYRTSVYRWSAGAVALGLAGRVVGGGYGLALRPALWLLTLSHLEAIAIALRLDAYRQPVRSLRACTRSPDSIEAVPPDG